MTRALDNILPTAALISMLAALWAVFLYVPDDAAQGPVQRIFYVHLAMWMATYTAFAGVCLASVVYLWKRTDVWDRLGRAAAELGLLFCTLGLATGAIWAKPIWGVWWTWDPRLTLTVVLWMIYAAYLLLRTMTTDPHQGALLAAILGTTGLVDIYLIRKAVEWWRGIHPAVLRQREGGSGLEDPAMQITLLLTIIAFMLLFFWLLRLRMQSRRLEDEVEELHLQVVQSR